LNELGVPTVYDPDEGIAAGGYFLASDIHPSNQTRSDARRNYYDPFFGRKSYNILQNSHVTRILFDSHDPTVSLHNALLNALLNDSQDNLGNLSTAQPFTSRKIRHSEKRQQNAHAPLRATGVEVCVPLL
jgi:hypothetical protein